MEQRKLVEQIVEKQHGKRLMSVSLGNDKLLKEINKEGDKSVNEGRGSEMK